MTMSAPFSYAEMRTLCGDYYGRRNSSVSAWQKSEQIDKVAGLRQRRIHFSVR